MTTYIARMIVEEDYVPEFLREERSYEKYGAPEDTSQSRLCRLRLFIRNAYVYKKIGSQNLEQVLPLLTEYYKIRDVTELRTQGEFTDLMGFL